MRGYQREPARPASKREPLLVVPLKHGGKDGGDPISELPLFRRVNVGDLEAADEANWVTPLESNRRFHAQIYEVANNNEAVEILHPGGVRPPPA